MDKKLIFNGKKISYRVFGEGPVVVLVHGFGEDGNIWKNQFPALPGYKLIVPDLPGTRDSELLDNVSMDSLADSIRAIADQEAGSEEKITVIGHSMGGYIAMAFAENHGERLSGLGLFHSSAFADSEEKKAVRKKGIGFINTHGPDEFLKTLIPTLYGPVTKEENPELIEAHIKSSHNFSGAALVSYYVSMMERPDRTHILKSIKIPVLLVLGRYDQAVPVEDGLKQAHMADFTYIHMLEKSGHMGMVEEINVTNEILKNYLTRNEKTA